MCLFMQIDGFSCPGSGCGSGAWWALWGVPVPSCSWGLRSQGPFLKALAPERSGFSPPPCPCLPPSVFGVRVFPSLSLPFYTLCEGLRPLSHGSVT